MTTRLILSVDKYEILLCSHIISLHPGFLVSVFAASILTDGVA